MTEPDDAPVPPSELRFLKWLVTVLTAVMILGIATIAGLLIFRLGVAPQPVPPALPQNLTLPEGAEAEAVTFGGDWIMVVTRDGAELLIFERADGTLRQRIRLD